MLLAARSYSLNPDHNSGVVAGAIIAHLIILASFQPLLYCVLFHTLFLMVECILLRVIRSYDL